MLSSIGVTPHVGVWIETCGVTSAVACKIVTPHVGVWIETRNYHKIQKRSTVTPHVGVWIETVEEFTQRLKGMSHLM